MAEEKKNIPKLRFREFTGDNANAWELRKLGEMGKTFSGLSGKKKEDFGHGNARFVTYMNVFNNTIANPKLLEKVELDNKQNKVKFGDVFFTTSSETPEEVGMSSIWLDDLENVYLNSFCFGYRTDIEMSPYYLAFVLRSPNVRKKFMVLAQGISRYNISKNKVMNISIPIPDIGEQQKIGSFFKHLDELITLHQRMLDEYKTLKKTMLSKMFPKNGEKYPELRFSGFTDAWELRKLGDIGSVAMNKRVFKHQTSDNGEIPFFKISTFGGKADTFISRKLFEEYKRKYPYPNKGDILLSASGSIGKIVVYTGEDEYFQDSNIVWFKHDGKINNQFLKQFYTIVKWDGLEGSTIKRLYNKNILNTNILLPVIREQEKIGTFFKHLDELITLHQRELELLKTLKKTMLQQMFV